MCRQGSKGSALELSALRGSASQQIAGGTPALRFRNHTAGNSITRVACGVGLLVVSLCVNDEGCASSAEQRMAVGAEVDIFIIPLEMRFAIGVRREVGIVAGMVAFRIIQSMLFPVRIEMRSGRLEVRSVATCVLMEMDGMFAGGQVHEIDLHPYPGGVLPKSRGAHRVALGIVELNHNFRRTGRGERHHEQCEREQAGFHGGNYSEIQGLARVWFATVQVWRRMRGNGTIDT